MLLKQLLKNLDYTLVQGCLNTEVTDIYYDSRKVTPGGLFVCIVGTQRDSHDYAADVAAKGAAVLAIQHDLPAEVLAALPDVTVVKFENTRYAMALLSTAYFGRPALEMTMVGVTGTKGKTTTTHMIKAVLEAAGHKVGMVGTTMVKEKHLEIFLKLLDNMSDTTIVNYLKAVGSFKLPPNIDTPSTEIYYLHGTKMAEMYAKKTAKYIKKNYPNANIITFDGKAHCEDALINSEEHINVLNKILR